MAGVIDGDIYFIGGYGKPQGGSSNICHSTIYKYSIAENTFTEVQDAPRPTYNVAYCYENNVIYMIGGQTTSSYLDYISTFTVGGFVTFDKNTMVISISNNDHNAKINDKIRVCFEDVYIYSSDKKSYISFDLYCGDGSKWTQIK